MELMPVTLPPGRLKLVTMPVWTGSARLSGSSPCRRRGPPTCRPLSSASTSWQCIIHDGESPPRNAAGVQLGASAVGPVAGDCVVELIGLEPTTRLLWPAVRVRPALPRSRPQTNCEECRIELVDHLAKLAIPTEGGNS